MKKITLGLIMGVFMLCQPALATVYCGCALSDIACIEQCMDGAGSLQLEASWPANWDQLPLSQRVSLADVNQVEWLQMWHIVQGLPDVPAVTNNVAVKNLFVQALGNLPASLIQLIETEIAGIVLVENMYNDSFGESTFVTGSPIEYTENSDISRAFLAFDVARVNNLANDKFDYTNNFIADGSGYEAKVKLAESVDNTVLRNLEFALIELLGHVVGIHLEEHPLPWVPASVFQSYPNAGTVFDNWELDATTGDLKIKDLSFLPLRDQFMANALSQSDIPNFFTQLHNTSFSSTTGLSNFWNDFAASFAEYVWVEVLNRPFETQILQNGNLQTTHQSCMQQGNCQSRKQLFENIFNNL